jgi:5-methylcytosine-specific restriction endonuclease McrA
VSVVIFSYRRGARIRHNGRGKGSPESKRRRNRANLTKAQRRVLYERDGHRCVICGANSDLTADHIIPVSRGGTKDLDNLQTLCAACNYVKGARLDWGAAA